jgi:hypothetical protein
MCRRFHLARAFTQSKSEFLSGFGRPILLLNATPKFCSARYAGGTEFGFCIYLCT